MLSFLIFWATSYWKHFFRQSLGYSMYALLLLPWVMHVSLKVTGKQDIVLQIKTRRHLLYM